MQKKTKIQFLNLLLIVLVAFGAFAVYMTYQSQQSQRNTAAANVADYDYDEIQEKVSLPEPEPEPTEDDTPLYDTEEMLSINPDFKGWLWIPDTSVNYPIVQSTDNNTYLYRSFQGTYSAYGSLFLDQESLPGSRNRVIHGHNMGNNRTEMFSSLINYQDPAWAGERPYAYFNETESTENDQYRLFAVLNFNTNDLDEFNYFQSEFETEEEFHTFISYLKGQSLYQTDYTPEGDTLILSTCNRKYGADNRLLVCFGLESVLLGQTPYDQVSRIMHTFDIR